MSFKGVSIFSSGGHFVQQSRTFLAFLVEDHSKEHFCEIILKSVQWYMSRSHLKVFLFLLWQPFCSVEQNDFSNLGRGSPKEHFCEIIWKSDHWSKRRCHIKISLFSALEAILFQQSSTILAILVDDYPKNISVNIL